LMAPTKKVNKLIFDIQYDEKIPKDLLGFRSAIFRILLNLVSNAFKFTHEGSVTLRASLGNKSTSKKAIIKLEVEDTGIGIPKNKQKIIFDRLTRLTSSYEGRYEGHGIGLYFVKKLAESINGEVYLSSEEGKGSCFSVVLPLKISLLETDEYTSLTNKMN